MPTRRAPKNSKNPLKTIAKSAARARAARAGSAGSAVAEREALQWRLDRLEQQMLRLTELIRQHAEDNDRLVRIVAEDRELIRKELVRRHQAQLRARDLLRRIPS